jgi:DNA-binding transcriptional regulator YiaG
MRPKGYSRNFIDANRTADPFHVGVQLGRICVERDIPVQDIAEYLNVSRQTVYMWFLGRTTPHPANRKLMWALLDRLAATAES